MSQEQKLFFFLQKALGEIIQTQLHGGRKRSKNDISIINKKTGHKKTTDGEKGSETAWG